MNIDFHTHGKLAKKLPFSKEYTDWLFEEAVVSGLDAICLTEHFNTQGFSEIYKYIKTEFTKDEDSYLTNKGLRIFPGMEVDIAEGGHTLVIGDIDSILELNHRLEKQKEKDSFMSANQWCELAKEYPVILGVGHPYREGGHIPELSLNVLQNFEFIEMNGKDTACYGDSNIIKLEMLRAKLDCSIVAGSDTHQSFQYGCAYNIFQKECSTIAELQSEMESGNYNIYVSENVEFKVKVAKVLKRALKAIHASGGDYVSVLVNEGV
ncbi:MAG: PHP domain-containing protein [Lachnotalea sp.]